MVKCYRYIKKGIFIMGFKNKKETKFVPVDLNETNVETIFKRCLLTNQSKEMRVSILFQKVLRI